ncbi:MAG: multiheme c-type cytochrome [Candidatus Rokuibacteriota bacterium]
MAPHTPRVRHGPGAAVACLCYPNRLRDSGEGTFARRRRCPPGRGRACTSPHRVGSMQVRILNPRPPDRSAEPVSWSRRTSRTVALGAASALAALAIAAGAWWWQSGRQASGSRAGGPPSARPTATYVGTQSCGECHRQALERWRGSHHDLAMQAATESSVAGNFDNARFTYAGITSSFFRKDGKFVARTDGPDGKLHNYEIKYTFGAKPLQQYLVEFPDGRRQALGIAWDTRPRAQGGQRWFHLYPGQNVTHRDELHWTGLSQNWNYMCAECHSTGVRKNYDPTTRRFATSYVRGSAAVPRGRGGAAGGARGGPALRPGVGEPGGPLPRGRQGSGR